MGELNLKNALVNLYSIVKWVTIDNLKKIKTKEHIEVIIEMVGIISDMKSIIM